LYIRQQLPERSPKTELLTMTFPSIQAQLRRELRVDDTPDPASLDARDGLHAEETFEDSPKIATLFSQLPWSHISVLSVILVTGLVVGMMVQGVQDSPGLHQSFSVRFFLGNAAALIVGFGFAIYGCVINRQLQRKIHDQTHLGPYTLHELIGSGGMGDVYLAEHRLLKRKCAVKLIRRDKASDRRMLARFEREVKATAQLTHWNTVQVYDYGRTKNGTFYYAMEYLQGLNLRQLIEQFGPQSPARVIHILRQLCGALHEAHCCGLVHRDVKPSNIFLTERGHVFDVAKLLDFGLVRPCQIRPGCNLLCPRRTAGIASIYVPGTGTRPETRLSRGYLFTGRRGALFAVRSTGVRRRKHSDAGSGARHRSRPASRRSGFAVPRDLSDIIAKCLSKHAADRYQTPRELQEALDKCECANNWTSHDAEAWWREPPLQIPGSVNEQTSVALDTQHVQRHCEEDWEDTLIPENRMAVRGVL
jgi:serine/threonine protein kinase